MSSYETPIQENNEKIEEQIKLLQQQLKPIQNPIVKKYLPFPYEVNVLILDYLEIEKKKHIYWVKLNKLLRECLYNSLNYYYKPRCYYNSFKVRKNRATTNYASNFDRDIRKEYRLEKFDRKEIIKEAKEFAWGHITEETRFKCNSEIEKVMRMGIEKVKNFNSELRELEGDLKELYNQYRPDRYNCEIPYGYSNYTIFYKIEGKKPRINPKPYKKFLEKISNDCKEKEEDIIKKLKLNNKGFYGFGKFNFRNPYGELEKYIPLQNVVVV